MKSLTLGLLTAIMVLFTVPSVSAQIDIYLSPSTSRVQFLSNGQGDFTLSLCAKVAHGQCVGHHLGGRASVVGYTGFYTITESGRISGMLISGKNCRICRWRGNGGSLDFIFSSEPNGGGVDLLTGTLQFMGMTQRKNMNGGFNQLPVLNFTVTGGMLAGYLENNGGGMGNLEFTTHKPIQRNSVFGRFDGTIPPETFGP